MKEVSLVFVASLFCVSSANAQVFEEVNGYVVAEVESVNIATGWVEETEIDGYSGDSYYRWDAENEFTTPGVGTLSFPILIHNDGRYRVQVRNFHNSPDGPTEENDVWVRIDNGPWTKALSNTAEDWVFNFTLEPSHGEFAPPHWDLAPGMHTVEISGRSQHFRIDRINITCLPAGDDTPHPDHWAVNLPETMQGATSGLSFPSCWDGITYDEFNQGQSGDADANPGGTGGGGGAAGSTEGCSTIHGRKSAFFIVIVLVAARLRWS